MKTRILTGIILLPFLILIYFGGIPLKIGCFIISIVGMNEFFKCVMNSGAKPSFAVGYLALALQYIPYILLPNGTFDFSSHVELWIVFTLIASMISGFKVNDKKPYDVMLTFFGCVYTELLPLYVAEMTMGNMKPWSWIVFIIAFGTDIFAYFTGMAIGKHKMCPNLSPKKSWEGAIGGLVFATGFSVLYAYFMFGGSMTAVKWGIIVGIIGSVMSQFGDLSASAIKRQMNIKDYGKLLPGHGGILDRFDSVLFAAPTVYYLLTILGTLNK